MYTFAGCGAFFNALKPSLERGIFFEVGFVIDFVGTYPRVRRYVCDRVGTGEVIIFL